MKNQIIVAVLCLWVAACAYLGKQSVAVEQLSFEQIDGWKDDNHQEALKSFLQSCHKLNRKRSDELLHETGLGGFVGTWHKLCKEALFTSYLEDDNAAKDFFEESFYPYRIASQEQSKGLITGYYEIVLKGSRKPTGIYKYPLYAVPPELQKGRKYYSREQIDKGALKRRKLELVWLDDPVEAFFLHVQGSGKIMLKDGSMMCVGFAGRNNHPYKSIGQYMIEKGWVRQEDMSADTIREWFKENPGQIQPVLHQNPSYIFFSEKRGCAGPIGGQGVELTPSRSAAIDTAYIPYGVPLWVDVTFERVDDEAKRYFKKTVIAQDTGSAIKGRVRVDLFLGTGKEAGHMAGQISDRGFIYLLLPKDLE